MFPQDQQGASSIAQHVHNCLSRFQSVSADLAAAEPHIKTKIPSGGLVDELGRFRVWSGNVGAHRKGRGSLDYKLREASHIRERVVELLQNAVTVLEELRAIVTGERISWEDMTDSDSDGCTSDVEGEDQPTTELSQLLSNLAEINTCLMRLSMSIRNPAPHDQFKESKHINFSHYETFDVEHTQEKLPHAAQYLVVRLGKAISRRRQFLRYREEHRKKYEQGLLSQSRIQAASFQENKEVSSQHQLGMVGTTSEEVQSTVASSIPWAVKTINSVAELDDSEETLSQTSYASSSGDAAKLRPPPLPETGRDGQPFECSLCFRMTSVRHMSAWHKHVFRDLQPYVCTFERCDIPDHTYESRHEWFQHELQMHRGHWECLEGCNETFQSSDILREHLGLAHPNLVSDTRLSVVLSTCYRSEPAQGEVECMLCMCRCPSLLQLRRHMGQHQEELSLFALPSYIGEDAKGSQTGGDAEETDSSRSTTSTKPAATAGIRCSRCNIEFEGTFQQQCEALQNHRGRLLHSDATRAEYSRWHHGIKSICEAKGTWERTEGTRITPQESVREDRSVQTDIFLALSEEIKEEVFQASGSLLPMDRTAQEMLAALNQRFGIPESSFSGYTEVYDSATMQNVGEDVSVVENHPDTSAALNTDIEFQGTKTGSETQGLFDNKPPTWQEVGRVVEANGGAELMEEHSLWANLGYDFDLGRGLTRVEVEHVKALHIIHNFAPVEALRPVAAGETGNADSPENFQSATKDARFYISSADPTSATSFAKEDTITTSRASEVSTVTLERAIQNARGEEAPSPQSDSATSTAERIQLNPLHDTLIRTSIEGILVTGLDEEDTIKARISLRNGVITIDDLMGTARWQIVGSDVEGFTRPRPDNLDAYVEVTSIFRAGCADPIPATLILTPESHDISDSIAIESIFRHCMSSPVVALATEAEKQRQPSELPRLAHDDNSNFDPKGPSALETDQSEDELLPKFKFDCPVKKHCIMIGEPPDCTGLSTSSLTNVRRHLSQAPHKYKDVNTCVSCGQVFSDERPWMAHRARTCTVQKAWCSAMERWCNIYRALFPDATEIPDPRNGWTSRVEAIATYNAKQETDSNKGEHPDTVRSSSPEGEAIEAVERVNESSEALPYLSTYALPSMHDSAARVSEAHLTSPTSDDFSSFEEASLHPLSSDKSITESSRLDVSSEDDELEGLSDTDPHKNKQGYGDARPESRYHTALDDIYVHPSSFRRSIVETSLLNNNPRSSEGDILWNGTKMRQISDGESKSKQKPPTKHREAVDTTPSNRKEVQYAHLDQPIPQSATAREHSRQDSIPVPARNQGLLSTRLQINHQQHRRWRNLPLQPMQAQHVGFDHNVHKAESNNEDAEAELGDYDDTDSEAEGSYDKYMSTSRFFGSRLQDGIRQGFERQGKSIMENDHGGGHHDNGSGSDGLPHVQVPLLPTETMSHIDATVPPGDESDTSKDSKSGKAISAPNNNGFGANRLTHDAHDTENSEFDASSDILGVAHLKGKYRRLERHAMRKERVVGFLKDPVTTQTRPISNTESWALYNFEMHARKCAYCIDPYEVHRSHEQLCEHGHRLAQDVASYIYTKEGTSFSTKEENGKNMQVEIPSDYIEVSGLLRAIERSLRHRRRKPFINMDRTSYVAPQESRVRSKELSAKQGQGSRTKSPRPRSGELVDWSASIELSNTAESKSDPLVKEDLAKKRGRVKSAVEVREPELRDARLSKYYR